MLSPMYNQNIKQKLESDDRKQLTLYGMQLVLEEEDLLYLLMVKELISHTK